MENKKILEKKLKGGFCGFAVLLAAVMVVFAGCWTGDDTNDGDDDDPNNSPIPDGSKITVLVDDTWADGAITENGSQWFKFTASASTIYVHANFGTCDNFYVQLVDSSGSALGDAKQLGDYWSNDTYTSFTATNGRLYYLKITQGDGYSRSHTGTFQIAFNTNEFEPGKIANAATLTEGEWENGSLISTSDDQWYKFIATAGTVYIHIEFGTCTNVDVKLYNSSLSALGDAIALGDYYDNDKSTPLMVTNRQQYYLRIISGDSYDRSHYGTYRIAFNTSETPPSDGE